jgi:hypothetical protein
MILVKGSKNISNDQLIIFSQGIVVIEIALNCFYRNLCNDMKIKDYKKN